MSGPHGIAYGIKPDASPFRKAFAHMVRQTNHRDAPCVVVPSDHGACTRLLMAGAGIDALEGMDLAFPPLDAAMHRELWPVRALLEFSSESAKDRGKLPVKLQADGADVKEYTNALLHVCRNPG
jgi:hypothetical protein